MNDEFLQAAHKGIPLSDYRAERLAALEAENERLKAVIYDLKHTYYQPRPEGSIVAKRDEYDTLTEIAMLIYHFQNDLRGAIPDAELTKLKTWLAKWYETLPEGE